MSSRIQAAAVIGAILFIAALHDGILVGRIMGVYDDHFGVGEPISWIKSP
jgi:hypothetical protein